MSQFTLQKSPKSDDTAWTFSVPAGALPPPRNPSPNKISGKMIKFTSEAITIQIAPFPSNRILHEDDPSKFILASFGDLRFPDNPLKVTADYIARLMKTGLFLRIDGGNSVQYRFYHHSNSQLRGRSCFLRAANSDAELDERIYQMGDYGRIMNIAKRAKRIGLLFSEAKMDYRLDPKYVADIPDIKAGDEMFSDGCGLISKRLAIQLSKSKKIIFRGARYTPCVFQIRYLGYKGVLMLHLDLNDGPLAQFRQSMKKFSTTQNTTFSVVDYSQPYAFGRLNNDIIVLLSSLGITNEKLLSKQRDYFQWISGATQNVVQAVDFLSCLGQYPLAERVLLAGLDDPEVSKAIRKWQLSEIASFRNKSDKTRSRMMIHKSRLIFGVCDPYKVLKEGEVHIRITTSRNGPATPIHGDVLVVRNPCLYPGDCLKLRAVHNNKLSHLVDCIVFASVARPGHHSAPAMSSGGDLDGDKYFVCWDPDLVPTQVAESYDYPPNKEFVSKQVTRQDLANHFAAYNNMGVAKVAALHAKWVRSSPKGALSSECQELNALHSQSVDGARIKIPDRLLNPPEPQEFVIDLLAADALKFAAEFTQSENARSSLLEVDAEEGKELMVRLLQSEQNALSEYELFQMAYALARKHNLDVRPYLTHLNLGALTTQQKYAISSTLGLSPEDHPYLWNSLFRSDLLTTREWYQRNLSQPFALQRLYSSKLNGLTTFFEYLRMATEEFTRKILIIKTDDRFSIGVFIRGEIPWDADPEINENVVVCSFMPHTSSTLSTYRPCTSGFRLHCSDTNFQLYNKQRADTFIFITRPPAASGADLAVSIALQKISARVQQQLGRVNRTPITAIELHVVSNRDRVAHQLFDLWFEHVPTEAFIRRFDRDIVPYEINRLQDVDWEKQPEWLKECFSANNSAEKMHDRLATKLLPQLDQVMTFALEYHAEDEAFWAFDTIISSLPLRREIIIKCMDKFPPLVYALMKKYPPDPSSFTLPPEIVPLTRQILENIIRSANSLGIATLVALEKIRDTIAQLSLELYFDLLWLTSLSIRAQPLLQECLLVLSDSRNAREVEMTDELKYGHKQALAIAFDRAEEAADECPCDEDGNPRRQRNAPTFVKLSFIPDDPIHVKAAVRVDARTTVRLHSHVRLQAASKPQNKWVVQSPILDGVVVQALKGELKIEILHPAPPEMDRMDWKMYNAGSIATSKATMNALLRLLEDGEASCLFHHIITGAKSNENFEYTGSTGDTEIVHENLNPSQMAAIESCKAPVSLIWGPPGTGKTTVVVQILRKLIQDSKSTDDLKILMTASTHNAVDNVLERFIEINKDQNILPEAKILRVATDQSKVNKALQHYTIDARVGGDTNENNKLVKLAKERVKAATLVFTTCAGAGLGVLREVDFTIALIDEGSQITEPCALIPLVKGIRRAVLVGDHVQLRPTVRKMGRILEFDVSLLERLYTKVEAPIIQKTMLNVQYRFPKELAEFPSSEFYEGRLRTGISNSAQVLNVLASTGFPWPRRGGLIVPTVFIQCSTEEDMGGASKSNAGQVELVQHIIPMLKSPGSEPTEQAKASTPIKITVLSPYRKQDQALKSILPSDIPSYTIDSFQGRESDIIIFSTVRCNAEGDVGFVEDPRRLNVMWTRARIALIIIGDRRTMTQTSGLWKRAIESCTEVPITVPEVNKPA